MGRQEPRELSCFFEFKDAFFRYNFQIIDSQRLKSAARYGKRSGRRLPDKSGFEGAVGLIQCKGRTIGTQLNDTFSAIPFEKILSSPSSGPASVDKSIKCK